MLTVLANEIMRVIDTSMPRIANGGGLLWILLQGEFETRDPKLKLNSLEIGKLVCKGKCRFYLSDTDGCPLLMGRY